MNAGFQSIEHTADVGLSIWGKTLEALFNAAAVGMFSLITPLDGIKTKKSVNIVVKGNDVEELLIDWLNELNFIFSKDKLLFNKFSIKLDKEKLIVTARCSGEKLDLLRHELFKEIKAATFSDLKIIKRNGVYKTTVIFDV